MANNVDAKLLKKTKFPAEFDQKVDFQKVNIEVIKKWIAGKISTILGDEDDVVIELCFNLLESNRFPDIKKLQIQLTGFLEKDTAKFCKELWSLCLSAQLNPQGVPKELLEAKKLELIQEKIEAEKVAKETDSARQRDQVRERDLERQVAGSLTVEDQIDETRGRLQDDHYQDVVTTGPKILSTRTFQRQANPIVGARLRQTDGNLVRDQGLFLPLVEGLKEHQCQGGLGTDLALVPDK
ncbi:MAG: hypothetical protein M1814_000271 [Vezdaea aestivalis]|nr:MAG: hypothetical protein M1814_000271 [Vezdaea aestivalis]